MNESVSHKVKFPEYSSHDIANLLVPLSMCNKKLLIKMYVKKELSIK